MAYSFTPVQPGNTNFTASFTYNGFPVFAPFTQPVSITVGPGVGAGSALKFLFTPDLSQVNTTLQNFLIQIVDNGTGSLVQNSQLFVNAVQVSSKDGYTYSLPLQAYSAYELRAKAPGYNDLVQEINVTPNLIPVLVLPASGGTTTSFNITSNLSGENVTLAIPGQSQNYINSYYGTLPGGVQTIIASAEGYQNTPITINVTENPGILSSTKFEKGVAQQFNLSMPANWTVYYQQDPASTSRTIASQGTGNSITFTPNTPGYYTLIANDYSLGTYQAAGFSFTSMWGPMAAWMWMVIALIAIIIIWIFVSKRKNKYTGGGGQGFEGKFNVTPPAQR